MNRKEEKKKHDTAKHTPDKKRWRGKPFRWKAKRTSMLLSGWRGKHLLSSWFSLVRTRENQGVVPLDY